MISARYSIKCLYLLSFFVLAAGLAFQGTASADEGYGPGQDRWKFALGAFFPSTNTDLKIDGTQVGDRIDLENFGYDDSDSLFRLDGYWRFFNKHRLEFGYYQFNRDANRRLDEEITIGDKIYEVGFLTSSELNLGFYTFDYLYSFYQGEKWEIAGGLGVYWVDLEFSITAALDINDNPIIGGPRIESTDFSGPLPFLALSCKWLYD